MGAPYWQPAVRGALFGLTRATSVADLARATLEGVAFQVGDLIEAINADLGTALEDIRVDGGMARSGPFLQFQADLLGLPIHRSPQSESTALGAGLLAGLGAGLWPDPSTALERVQAGGHAILPARDAAWRTRAQARWRKAVTALIEHHRGN
jgi:glycerol kinase